jgi:hypothetical protein
MTMRKTSFSEFFPDRYGMKLEAAEGIPQIFNVVMQAVKEQMGFVRSGLELGLVDLEGDQGYFTGCLHPFGTNLLVVNRLPLRRVRESFPQICKSYIFNVLIHEYMHTVGIWDENRIHDGILELTVQLFGEDHPATKLAEDMGRFFPFIIYPAQMPLPEGTKIELL